MITTGKIYILPVLSFTFEFFTQGSKPILNHNLQFKP